MVVGDDSAVVGAGFVEEAVAGSFEQIGDSDIRHAGKVGYGPGEFDYP